MACHLQACPIITQATLYLIFCGVCTSTALHTFFFILSGLKIHCGIRQKQQVSLVDIIKTNNITAFIGLADNSLAKIGILIRQNLVLCLDQKYKHAVTVFLYNSPVCLCFLRS